MNFVMTQCLTDFMSLGAAPAALDALSPVAKPLQKELEKGFGCMHHISVSLVSSDMQQAVRKHATKQHAASNVGINGRGPQSNTKASDEFIATTL